MLSTSRETAARGVVNGLGRWTVVADCGVRLADLINEFDRAVDG
jgi:hypothetical protein